MRKRSKFHRNFSESGAYGVSTAGDVIPNGLSRALRKAGPAVWSDGDRNRYLSGMYVGT